MQEASYTLMTPNPCHKHGLGVGTSYHMVKDLGAGGGWLNHSGKEVVLVEGRLHGFTISGRKHPKSTQIISL